MALPEPDFHCSDRKVRKYYTYEEKYAHILAPIRGIIFRIAPY